MIWFTSDQHFYHKNVIKYCKRPFSGGFVDRVKTFFTGAVSDAAVAAMNAELIRRHNAVVKPTDVVYHLGDFSLWKHAPAAILPHLKGTHHLIAGNHDWCHPVTAKKKTLAMQEAYRRAGFASVQLEMELPIAGQLVTLHHMPFANCGKEEVDSRYTHLRPRDTGQILLHGHVHEHWRIRGRMINVGVDVWDYAPVSMDQIAELVRLLTWTQE